MQSAPALSPGSLIAENARILELVSQDAFYVSYSAKSTVSGEKIGLTEFYPVELVARAPSGDVLLQSLELQALFNLGRDRFITETKALSELRHPNLLRFDGVVSDHGTAFALHAPEEGQSLFDFVKSSKQPPPQEEIDASVKQLVSALDVLHSRGLIHANITPDTILLRPAPLLIRFGAPRSCLAARMQKVNLAVTPGYSAPELHFSDAKGHGPLCDVYSLAAVLYFVVTGRHPINVIARGLGHTMPPAAAVSSKNFRPQFLEAIDRGLEPEPERRPPTIEAFGEMLLGSPEKRAPESTQPALQVASTPSESSQAHPRPGAPLSNGASLSAKVSTPQPSTPPAATDDEEDDELDDHEDFGGGWQGLGIGRVLVLALVLALFVSAGLWMLEAQFKKQEQAARLASGSPLPLSDAQPTVEGADKIIQGADQAFNKLLAEGLRDLPQKTEQPREKIKEAEEKRDKAGEESQTLVEASAPRVSGQKQGNEIKLPETKPEPQREQIETTMQKPKSLVIKDCENCPELVAVPEGSFLMGSRPHEEGRGHDNGEDPQRRVAIEHPFAVGRFAITVDEFKAFADDTGYRTGNLCAAGNEYIAKSAGSFEAPPGFAAGFMQSGRHPVVCVSWLDAKAFVAWLSHKTKRNYRLLTEAEREYVTRAGTSTEYWWGDDITPAQALYDASPAPTQKPEISAAVNVPSSGGTTPVDQFQPNAWGLFQVHGNVAEWVEDCWRATIAEAASSPAATVSANCKDHVLRGGAWSYPKTALRAAFREHAPADGRYNHVGFRVARDLDQQ